MGFPANWRNAALFAAVVAVGVAFVILNATAVRQGVSLLPEALAKLGHLSLWLVFWAAIYPLGRLAERLITGRRSWPPELALTAGMVAAVYLLFALCAARLAYPWVIRVLVAGGAAAGFYWLRRDWGRAPGRARQWLGEVELASAALLIGVVVLAFSPALTAAEPPYYWDALTYHLAVPKFYAAAHGFTYLPDNVYASMPMGATLFYLGPYMWDGLVCANASHLVATVCALGLSYRLARLRLGQFPAALTAAFVALTPTVLAVAGGAHVDNFLILFVVAALYLYCAEGGKGGRKALAVGFFLGAALATKYAAFAAVAAFLPLWVYDLWKKRVRLGEVAIIVAVAAAFLVPWFAKAYVERGNPVFPLAYDVFGGRDFSAEQARRLVAWQTGMGKGRGLVDYALLPYRISTEAGYTYEAFHGVYLPFLLPLAALALAFYRRVGRFVAFGWVYLAAWALGPQQLRFLGGALPALAAAAAATVGAVEDRTKGFLRGAWRAAAVAAFLVVGMLYNSPAIYDTLPGHAYLAGMSAEQFLTHRCPFYRAQLYINRQLPAEAKVLTVFSNQILYMERAASYDSFLEASAFLIAAEEAEGPEELYRRARGEGATHVYLYRVYEAETWRYYSPAARERFYEFLWRYGVTVYGDEAGHLFEVVAPEGGA
ncbi:MAG: glycosyltransferase family 39 protein [Candidatus Coatesbacteria bacterium]|nr:MAG: glycosyltransferase family 39 protein [Candidatus Coatesbacteria bacterium]